MQTVIALSNSAHVSSLKYRNQHGKPQAARRLIAAGRYPDMARAMKHICFKHETDRVVERRARRAVRRSAGRHIAEQLDC